jgi:hypothetical protein
MYSKQRRYPGHDVTIFNDWYAISFPVFGVPPKRKPGIHLGLFACAFPGQNMQKFLDGGAKRFFYFFGPLQPFVPSSSGGTNRSSSMLMVTAVTRPTTETSFG